MVIGKLFKNNIAYDPLYQARPACCQEGPGFSFEVKIDLGPAPRGNPSRRNSDEGKRRGPSYTSAGSYKHINAGFWF